MGEGGWVTRTTSNTPSHRPPNSPVLLIPTMSTCLYSPSPSRIQVFYLLHSPRLSYPPSHIQPWPPASISNLTPNYREKDIVMHIHLLASFLVARCIVPLPFLYDNGDRYIDPFRYAMLFLLFHGFLFCARNFLILMEICLSFKSIFFIGV